jgi:hypothetical protein
MATRLVFTRLHAAQEMNSPRRPLPLGRLQNSLQQQVPDGNTNIFRWWRPWHTTVTTLKMDVLPWVVGVRGLIRVDPRHFNAPLSF